MNDEDKAFFDSFVPVKIRPRKSPYSAPVGTLFEAISRQLQFGGLVIPFKPFSPPVFFVTVYKDSKNRRVYCLTPYGIGYLCPGDAAFPIDCTKPSLDVE